MLLHTKQVKMQHFDTGRIVYVNKFEVKHYIKNRYVCYTEDTRKVNPTDTGRHIGMGLPSVRITRDHVKSTTCFTILFFIASLFLKPFDIISDLLNLGFKWNTPENREWFLDIGEEVGEVLHRVKWGIIGLVVLFPVTWGIGYAYVSFLTR